MAGKSAPSKTENAFGFPGSVVLLTDRRLLALPYSPPGPSTSSMVDMPISSISRLQVSGGRGPILLKLKVEFGDYQVGRVKVPRRFWRPGRTLA